MASAMMVEVDGRELKITSPDKVVFEQGSITKATVVKYFQRVGPQMVASLAGRPITLERWPHGVRPGFSLRSGKNREGEAFYQKSLPTSAPEWLEKCAVTYPSGRQGQQLVVSGLASVIWAVQQGTLRFHAWPVRVPQVDLVDQLRIDLDPQPGTTFDDAVEVAVTVREVLGEAGVGAWIKTSGGRGLHVYCPVEPIHFIDARHATIAVGREVVRRLPSRACIEWWKENRGQRVFIDFNQMARDRLMASAYSIRPTSEATVSMPVSWQDLSHVQPQDFTVASVLDGSTTGGDAWADMDQARPASLATALEWYQRDAARGEGEMPYPPEYPKMPGEPPRVQPSRARQPKSEEKS